MNDVELVRKRQRKSKKRDSQDELHKGLMKKYTLSLLQYQFYQQRLEDMYDQNTEK